MENSDRHSELKIAAARYVLGQIRSAELIQLADKMLNHGIFAEGFAQIWNLPEPTMSEVAPAFEAALRELQIEMPSNRQAKKMLLDAILKSIAEEQVNPVQGLNLFVDWYRRNLSDINRCKADSKVQHQMDTLWTLYCLYWSYDELEFMKSVREISPKNYDLELRKLEQDVTDAAERCMLAIGENWDSIFVDSGCRT